MEKLQEISGVLEGTQTGGWLSPRLEKLADENKQLKVSLLISSIREVEKNFPNLLKIRNEWQSILPEDVKCRGEEIEASDLVIWGMTAMKLFPSEYTRAFDIIRKGKIPIWAVVVGLGRVSNRDNYYNDIIPREKSKLPENSEFFLKDSETSDQIIERIEKTLDVKAYALSMSGRSRREKSIVIKLRERLVEEKGKIIEEIKSRERYHDKSYAGVRAILVMTGSYSKELIASYQSLSDRLMEFRGRIEKNIDDKETLNSDEIKEQLKIFQDFRGMELEITLKAEKDKIKENLNIFKEKIATDLNSYFQPPESIQTDAGKVNLDLNENLLIDKLTIILEKLSSQLLESYDLIARSIKVDWILKTTEILGKEVKLPRKEQQENNEKPKDSSDADEPVMKGDENEDDEDKNGDKTKPHIIPVIEHTRQQMTKNRFIHLLIKSFDECIEEWEDHIKNSTGQIKDYFYEVIEECTAPSVKKIDLLIKEKQRELDKIITAEKIILDM